MYQCYRLMRLVINFSIDQPNVEIKSQPYKPVANLYFRIILPNIFANTTAYFCNLTKYSVDASIKIQEITKRMFYDLPCTTRKKFGF